MGIQAPVDIAGLDWILFKAQIQLLWSLFGVDVLLNSHGCLEWK